MLELQLQLSSFDFFLTIFVCFCFSICGIANRNDRCDRRPDIRRHSILRLSNICYEDPVPEQRRSWCLTMGEAGTLASGERNKTVWPAHNEQDIFTPLH